MTMMIKIIMFPDRICSRMIELTLAVFVSRAACSCPFRVGGCSLSSVFPFITHRGRRIHPFPRLLFRFMVQRTRHINVGVLVLLRFVSFPGLKNEAYTCVLSLFRRAFAPFHSFTVLVSTRGLKCASPARINIYLPIITQLITKWNSGDVLERIISYWAQANYLFTYWYKILLTVFTKSWWKGSTTSCHGPEPKQMKCYSDATCTYSRCFH